MSPHPDPPSRREFLAAASAGAALTTAVAAAEPAAPKLPHKVLGKTGVSVPVLGLGTAPAGHRPEKDAVALYHACLDAGVTYLDTAPELGGYGAAQKHLAHVLKGRRDEAFVVTKCFEPDGDKALALLRANLKELGIDRADLVYAHSIGDDKMPPEAVFGPAGVAKALDKAKRDGLTRFAGVSGHNRPARFVKALDDWDFDVMMTAVGLVARHTYDFERTVWPAAARKKVGVAAMKVFGGVVKAGDAAPRLPADLRPAALRYALGLPEGHVVVVGMQTVAELRENLARVRDYRPLTADELAALDAPTKTLAKAWGPVYGAVS